MCICIWLLKNAYLMHFSSLGSRFHCRVCYYLKCSFSLNQVGSTEVKQISFCQNLFQLMYNHRQSICMCVCICIYIFIFCVFTCICIRWITSAPIGWCHTAPLAHLNLENSTWFVPSCLINVSNSDWFLRLAAAGAKHSLIFTRTTATKTLEFFFFSSPCMQW